MAREGYVYILASRKHGTLYIGVTGNLVRRVFQHQQEELEGFTQKYRVKKLVYFESHQSMYEAISREKALKKWNRVWKIRLIQKKNPEWLDLSKKIY